MIDPLYLLYRTGLAPTSGTSVYLSRLLNNVEDAVVHLMWDVSEAGAESVEQVVVADNSTGWRWPFPRGGGFYARWRKRCGLNWWDKDRLNKTKLIRKLCAFGPRPQRAWVICMQEWDASRACALWEGVDKPPFVLHVMDILHDRLTEAETPKFRRLIREASHVICINEKIAVEVQNSGARSVSLLPCCSDFSAVGRQPLESPLRIVASGTLWSGVYPENPARRLLIEAWPGIKRQFPGVELHYSGATGKQLPEELQGDIRDHGLLSHDAYQDLLRKCHLAYLPVSHPSNTVARFSLPSRQADYLACGLPIIACTDEGTAIASFLRSLPGDCSANVANVRELSEAITLFAGNSLRWSEASAKAAAFAREQLRVEKVRAELFRQLERC